MNKITSVKDEYPIEYYHLPFCHPLEGIKLEHESLGEFLSGDRIENSPYRIKMKTDMYCEQVCYINLKDEPQKKLEKAIQNEYHNNWIVDNLPSASKISEDENKSYTRYYQGFPLGFVDPNTKEVYINNHVNIELEYHEVDSTSIAPTTSDSPEKMYRIVRFTVEPMSIKHEFERKIVDDDDKAEEETDGKEESDDFSVTVATIKKPVESCDPEAKEKKHTGYWVMKTKNYHPQSATGDVLFTYDVTWKENKEVVWASRWDIYLSMNVPDDIHWFSITNSLIIVLVLTILLAGILVKNVRSDYDRYSKVFDEEADDEGLGDSGWKLVHADVFRAPARPLIFAVFCGSGVQILTMSTFTLIFAIMGFLNPSRRGSLISALLVLYVLMGGVAGYVTARFYKSFNGKNFQRATFATAFGFPSFFFGIFFLMNLLAVAKRSGDAVPFIRMIELLVIWFGVSTPLVFVGAFFGYKVDAFDYPVNVSSLPRQIPDQPWYLKPTITLFFGGILSFGSCFLELYFILSSIWMDQYYYIFGFLSLTFLILLVTVAESTILLNYIQLCYEDYHWWWRSFMNGGSIAIFVYLYAMSYFKQLETNSVATYFLYFGYMGLICFALFLLTGSLGVLTSLWFNKKIFGAIKID